MDLIDLNKIRVQIQLTTWPQSIKNAEAILEIAKQHQKQSQLLSACACIVLATALEQATWSKLELARKEIEADLKDGDPDRYFKLMTEAFFIERVRGIPPLFTEGQMEFDDQSLTGRSLHKLIYLRNRLLHIREGVLDMQTGDHALVVEKGHVKIKSRLPSNPWECVTLNDACKFRDAIAVYFREVIEPEQIKPGKIIKKVSHPM